MSAPPEILVRQILSNTKSDQLFEWFCVQHYSDIEGTRYVPTSKNYDLARDGRTEYIELVRGAKYICASIMEKKQKDDLLKKATRDVTRLLKGDRRPAQVRICFTENVSEPERERIVAALQPLAKRCKFEVSGLEQITGSVKNFSDAFEQSYEAELSSLTRYGVENRAGKEAAAGMRWALRTALSPDAHKVRTSILSGMILEILSEDKSLDAHEIRGDITRRLSLLTVVESYYVGIALAQCEEAGWINCETSAFRITTMGLAELCARNETACRIALDGCSRIRAAIENVLDAPIPDRQFGKIWLAIEDGLVSLFLLHGQAVTRSVSVMAQGQELCSGTVDGRSLRDGLQSLAASIGRLDINEQTAAAVAAIIPHILGDPMGDAFEWLSHLCVMYVVSCSLCLHPRVQNEVAQRLKNWEVIPDTHVCLSLVGDGERDHAAIERIFSTWIEMGGKVFAAQPVIEEVSHHAQIANQKLDNWISQYRRHSRCAARQGKPALPPQDNVSLRGFAAVAGGDYTPDHCQRYVGQYYRSTDQDSSRIQAVLTQDHRFIHLEDPKGFAQFAATIAHEMLTQLAVRNQLRSEEDESYHLRCRVDGRLLAILADRRRAGRGTASFPVILSFSPRLRQVSEKHRGEFGMPSAVIGLAPLAFALALLPEASMNLECLRTILFGGDFGRHASHEYERAKKLFSAQKNTEVESYGPSYLREMMDGQLTKSAFGTGLFRPLRRESR